MMTSRERVLTSIRHQLPDRMPVHVLGFDDVDSWYERFGVQDELELRRALGLDLAPNIAPEYVGPEVPKGWTMWGTKTHMGNVGYSQTRGGHPLQNALTVGDIDKHSWPSADVWDYTSLRRKAAKSGELARPLRVLGEPLFCNVLDLFGMEQGMMRLHTDPVLVEAAVAHILDYYLEALNRSMDAAGDTLDICWYWDDFATQRGLMISPEHWRRFFAPGYRRIIDTVKSHGLIVWFHACGSFVEVLPDLVDMGIDVWETCQVHLEGNDPAFLKREFGQEIAFYGAINTQYTLPFGSVAEVRKEVRERIDVLGVGGGYICGTDHTVRPEVPVENLLALIDEAKTYRNPKCVR